MAEALSADINPQWHPDLILDIAAPIDPDFIFQTRRFGAFSLRRAMFEKIIVMDVLEHVSDLAGAMSNILFLLKDHGELKIAVPYELSLGAWQDPTHCRCFNENSWKYYTEWFWYLGWKDYRFTLLEQKFIPSAYGRKLLEMGKTAEEILRIPRAVDAIHARFKKIKTTPAERQEFVYRTNAFYRAGCQPWQ